MPFIENWSYHPCLIAAISLLIFGGYTLGGDVVIITNLDVPPYVEKSANVQMTCEHNLRQERLYSVQWLHNGNEFYKFSPKDEIEPKIHFADSGIDVDLEESTNTTVVIRDVKVNESGIYRCKVMGESPDFLVDYKEGSMVVTVIPHSKPVIEPLPGNDLRISSEVNMNCSTAPSIPAAKLEWEINGKKVPEEYLTCYNATKNEDGLFVSVLGLRFIVEKKHFRNSEMNLKCTARIATLYMNSDEHNHQSPFPQDSNEAPAGRAVGTNLMSSGESVIHLLWGGLVTLPLVLGLAR